MCVEMERSKQVMIKKQKQKQKQLRKRGCKAFCCSSCRLSVSEEAESSGDSDRFQAISSISHAMVQERLDQIIRETQRARMRRLRREETTTKFVVMVAMEKCSYDPREDFRTSIEEMIVANRIREAKDLRRLLDYYVAMNSEEFRSVILEVFHDVCTNLFL